VFPSSAAEHVFADSRIIIREDEPTSIIAFTLASKPYRDKLRNIAHQARSARKMESTATDETLHADRTASSWDMVTMDEVAEQDDPLNRDGGTHLKYGECGTSRELVDLSTEPSTARL
jgi:1-phosphatidylinositol-3-phosphate 5-kinase